MPDRITCAEARQMDLVAYLGTLAISHRKSGGGILVPVSAAPGTDRLF
jgi:hypothetical protein